MRGSAATSSSYSMAGLTDPRTLGQWGLGGADGGKSGRRRGGGPYRCTPSGPAIGQRLDRTPGWRDSGPSSGGDHLLAASTRIDRAVLAPPRTPAQVQARCYACMPYTIAGRTGAASKGPSPIGTLADPARPSQLSNGFPIGSSVPADGKQRL